MGTSDDASELAAQGGMPGDERSYRSFLHEFLYVDVSRLRSYLAQLTGGLPERISEAVEQGRTNDIGFKFSGLGYERAGMRATRWEESRTYGDLLVPLFEEHAEAAGFLTDLTGEIDQPSEWRSGQVHGRLEVGQLFRWSGLVRLFDAAHMADSVTRFEGMVKNLAKLQPSGGQQRKSSGRTTQPGGAAPGGPLDARGMSKITEPIREVLRNLLAGGIGLRMLPCGADESTCGFGGLLLDRSDYIEPERAALFSRHGFEPSDWTVVASVARMSKRSRSAVAPQFDAQAVTAQGAIDRGRIEEMALDLLSTLEGFGLTEAPAWPSIAVTPLAVYRTVVTASQPQDGSF